MAGSTRTQHQRQGHDDACHQQLTQGVQQLGGDPRANTRDHEWADSEETEGMPENKVSVAYAIAER